MLSKLGDHLPIPVGVHCSTRPIPTDDRRLDDPGLKDAWKVATAGMSPKRRAEFVTGRLCACEALAQAGVVSGCLPRADNRLPVWPPDWIGSISHTASWAAAVAARQSDYRAIGIDIQERIVRETVDDVADLIARPYEIDLLADMWERQRTVTLLFSAKEAVYKALFPEVRRFQDFDAAILVGCSPGTLTLQLADGWGDQSWPSGTLVGVRYAWMGDIVAAIVFIPVTQPTDDGSR